MFYWIIEASGNPDFPVALEIRSRTDPDYREVYDRYRTIAQAVEFMNGHDADDFVGTGLEGAEPFDPPAFQTIKTTAPSRVISISGEPEIECEMI
jgi:hypothetical protein